MQHHHRPWPTAHIVPEASETPEMWEKGSFPGQRDKLGPQQRNKLHTQPKKDQIYAHTCQEGRDIYSLCLLALAEYCYTVCKMFKSSHAVEQANGMQRSLSYMHAPLIHTYKGHQAYMIHQRFCQILSCYHRQLPGVYHWLFARYGNLIPVVLERLRSEEQMAGG
jgi:hypothetical protein